jgi:hypothetical protein
MLAIGDNEPNNTGATAQIIPLGDGPGQDRDLDIAGSISPNTDVDFFRFTAAMGDVIGLGCLGQGGLDPLIGITDLGEIPFIENDDHGGIATIYPAASPFPGGVLGTDSALTWVVPAAGDYLIRVESFNNATTGTYTLEIRSRRPAFEAKAQSDTQIIFLDLNGATVNAAALFGSGSSSAVLSGMPSFLAGWGLSGADATAVKDAIVAVVQENLDDLRLAGLNGDRDTDFIDGHFDVELRNSIDHADPFGQPNVSRVIIGGTIAQLGISTIGIAESIDPGNFGAEETAVVLLDLLSDPVPPPNANSINNMARDPGFTIIDAIGRVVGNVVSHEIGHFLGNWHTNNANSLPCIMDQGGFLAKNMGGIGPDNILGTGDDLDTDFVGDVYISSEAVAVGTERTDVRTAFALATGTTAPAPVFESTGVNVIDDSDRNGNNNGNLDPGETSVELTLQVINNGSLGATGVSATLVSNSANVSVTSAASAYPDLGIGISGNNNIPFVIAIDNAHQCGESIDLELQVSSNEGSSNVALSLDTGGPGASNTLFFDDMESGAGNWTVSGLWHLQANSACVAPPYQSSVTAMAFNQEVTCNYSTGAQAAGALTMSGDVAIPALALAAELTWFDYIETETFAGFDRYQVQVSTNGGGAWSVLLDGFAADAVWNQETIDLSAFIGNSIRIRFVFDSIDSQFNTFDGWYVDDVRIAVTPSVCEAPCIPADTDCDGDVDGIDFAVFASCFNGAGQPPRTTNCTTDESDRFDFDGDSDVDGVDFSKFASCYNGAGNPTRTLNCPQE